MNFVLFASLVMTTKKPFRSVRAHVPVGTYAKIAFLAAEAGLTVGQFVQAALIDAVATCRPVFLDGVGVPPEPSEASALAVGADLEDLLG